jgi:hypothetical protein
MGEAMNIIDKLAEPDIAKRLSTLGSALRSGGYNSQPCIDAIFEIEALRASKAELLAALEPFAKIADMHYQWIDDRTADRLDCTNLHLRDFRRARAAIAKFKGTTP